MRSKREIFFNNTGLGNVSTAASNCMTEHTNDALDELLTRVFASLSEGKAKNEADFNSLLLSTVHDIKNDMK